MPSLAENTTTTTPPNPDFKHTELGWIPKDWEVMEIKDITKIYDGTHSTPKYVENGIPFYSVEHISKNDFTNTKYISKEIFEKENKRVKLEKGDVLMSRIGNVGKAKLIDWDVEASFYVTIVVLKKNKFLISKFFESIINGESFQKEIFKRTLHVAFPQKINLGDINKCSIVIPPLPEQKAIADCLSTWDKAIEKQQQLIHAKQQQHKGLRQILLTGKKRLTNPETGKAFDGEWVEKRLGDLIEICSSKRVLKKDWKSKGIPFYRTREIINLSNNQDFRTPIYIEEKLFEELKTKYGVPKSKDILATGVGTIGELYRVKKNDKFYFKDGNVLWFKMNNNLSTDFLFHSFKTRYIKKQLFDNASITTVATFTIDGARKTKVKLPSLQEQTAIAEVLETSSKEIEILQNQLHQLQLQKKGLMQVLLSGHKRLNYE